MFSQMNNHYLSTVLFFFVLKIWQNKQKMQVFLGFFYGIFQGKISLFGLFMAFSQILLKYSKIVSRHGNMAFELPW
jgi:hypothetical protein